MITNKDIINKAREALGVRWVHQGRTLRGLDCIGLILWTLRQLKVADYEPPAYAREANWNEFLGQFRAKLLEIPIDSAVAGNIICTRQLIYPCHCAFISELPDGTRSLLHAAAKRRKVIEERYTDGWRKITVCAFQIPGVAS